jgi:spermidine synthase
MDRPVRSMTLMPLTSSPARTAAAVFLLSCSALLFQVAQTRLFSATLGYHLTFVAVSIALLGVGAGATAAASLDGRARRPSSVALAVLASASYVLALAVAALLDPATIDSSLAIVLIYVASSLPYTLVSWVVVRALVGDPAWAGRTYAADLVGAALGGVIAFVAMSALGAPGEYGLAAALAAVAALVLATEGGRGRVALAVVLPTVLFTLALASFGDALAPIRTAAFKPILDDIRRGATIESGGWDPQGRVDVVRHGRNGSSDVYDFLVDPGFDGPRPRSLVMRIDFDAATLIIEGGTKADGAVFEASVLAAPYLLVDQPDVLVIGPGGGIDVLVALHGEARTVTGVDLNRAVIGTVRGPYGEYGGALYDDPRVTVVADEARSFVRRSGERYDVIVMTVVDSWAALQSGAYALSESYLYTEEAFADYVSHLNPDGVLSIGRWYRDTPSEMVQAMEVASAGLRRLGVDRPERHLAVIRSAAFGLLLVRAGEFDDASMSTVRDFAGEHGFDVEYDPVRSSGALAAMYPSSGGRGPSTDDRPFFFDSVPLGEALAGRAPLGLGHLTLLAAMIMALALSFLLILLPLRRGLSPADPRLMRWVTAYAVLFGAGFIIVEIVLLQRLTLYLGQPTLALAVGVAGLLSGAAVGSANVHWLPGGMRGATIGSTVALATILVVFPIAADATLAAPLVGRMACALLFSIALGLPLGTAFPRVLRAAGAGEPRLVAWAWGVNGAASVVGSIVAAGLALETGFTSLAWVAIACYAVAALLGEPARARAPALTAEEPLAPGERRGRADLGQRPGIVEG